MSVTSIFKNIYQCVTKRHENYEKHIVYLHRYEVIGLEGFIRIYVNVDLYLCE